MDKIVFLPIRTFVRMHGDWLIHTGVIACHRNDVLPSENTIFLFHLFFFFVLILRFAPAVTCIEVYFDFQVDKMK